MSSYLVLLIAAIAWCAWLPATVLQKRARRDHGGVSILPVLPIFPLLAWGLAAMFHLASLPLGATAIGLCHLGLLVVFLASIGKSMLTLRRSRNSDEA